MPGAGIRGDLRKQMSAELERMAKEESEKMIDELIERANDVLREAARNRDWNMGPIIESVEKEWTGDRWVARWTYEDSEGTDIAAIFEYGAAPHEIRPDDAEALHWESGGTEQTTRRQAGGETGIATQERDPSTGQFAEGASDEDVFAAVVQHPGIEAVGYVRAGRRHVLDHYEVD